MKKFNLRANYRKSDLYLYFIELTALRDPSLFLGCWDLRDNSFLSGFFDFVVLESFVSFFNERKLNTSLWKKSDDWFLRLSNDEAVVNSGSESVSVGILNVGNIEA